MSADPICLGCAGEIAWSFAERRWESTVDGSPTCATGRNAGRPHTIKLPGRAVAGPSCAACGATLSLHIDGRGERRLLAQDRGLAAAHLPPDYCEKTDGPHRADAPDDDVPAGWTWP